MALYLTNLDTIGHVYESEIHVGLLMLKYGEMLPHTDLLLRILLICIAHNYLFSNLNFGNALEKSELVNVCTDLDNLM